jgi:hypothetical protein
MIYNLKASAGYFVTPGLKVFNVDPGLENVLTPGTVATIESGPYWMSGMIVGYKQGQLTVDVEMTNTMKKDAYSETWNIVVDSVYTNPASKEVIAGNYEIPTQSVNLPGFKYDITPIPVEIPVENPYIAPVKPPENPYIAPVKPLENPYIAPPEVVPSAVPYQGGQNVTPPPEVLIETEQPFYVVYMIPIIVLIIALIIGIVLYFVFKN